MGLIKIFTPDDPLDPEAMRKIELWANSKGEPHVMILWDKMAHTMSLLDFMEMVSVCVCVVDSVRDIIESSVNEDTNQK